MNIRPEIKLENGEHRQQPVVWVRFAYNSQIIEHLKQTSLARWSSTKRCWYVYEKNFNLYQFYETFSRIIFINYSQLKRNKKTTIVSGIEKEKITYDLKALKSQLSNNTKEKIEGFNGWMQQSRYSENTVKTYIHQLEIFFGYYHNKDVKEILISDISDFNYNFILKNKLSSTFQNQTISALKKFYSVMYHRSLEAENLKRPRKSHSLPKVMSKSELQVFFKNIKNIKWLLKLFMLLAYDVVNY